MDLKKARSLPYLTTPKIDKAIRQIESVLFLFMIVLTLTALGRFYIENTRTDENVVADRVDHKAEIICQKIERGNSIKQNIIRVNDAMGCELQAWKEALSI